MGYTNSKDFFDNEVEYWVERTDQANTDRRVKDRAPDDKVLETYFGKLKLKKGERFLDFGCGFGRLYRIYNNKCAQIGEYIGLDLSEAAIEFAQEKFDKLEIGKNLFSYDGLNIPFRNNSFDKILSFGVLDVCDQERVLFELLRILKPGGVVLCTGKNRNYLDDDEYALTAEINARKKDYPNHFTNVKDMISQLGERGGEVLESYYFVRRNDFAKDLYVTEMPEKFYEWALLIKKNKDSNKTFEKFCDAYSYTYERFVRKSNII